MVFGFFFYTEAIPAKSVQAGIVKTMCVADIVALCPESKDILAEYGLHCFGCEQNAFETLEDGCLGHGFEPDEIDELVSDLNSLIREMPERPASLTLTAPAARAIRDVAKSEKKTGEGLAVIVDGHGGFCMEFRPEPQAGEQTFRNQEEPDVRIFASVLTLKRIGGATIDFRDGRFKLDLPAGDRSDAACGCGDKCDCT